MKKWIKRISVGFLLIVLLLLVAEVTLRLKGFSPFQPQMHLPEIEPEHFITIDPLLGFKILPGDYHVSLGDYAYDVKHNSDSTRATSVIPSANKGDHEVWFMGCSFTYGYHINDEETFPWKIQEAFPNYHIKNHGVLGYGMSQVYLQLKSMVKYKQLPEVVVVNYASFHDMRNTLARNFRKQIIPFIKDQNKVGFAYPQYSIEADKLKLNYVPCTYSEWPLMRQSSLVHALEVWYNNKEEKQLNSVAISQLLLLEMYKLSQQHGFMLLITDILGDPKSQEMLRYCNQLGIKTLDISTDLNAPNMQTPIGHPSGKANDIYARKLQEYLKTMIN